MRAHCLVFQLFRKPASNVTEQSMIFPTYRLQTDMPPRHHDLDESSLATRNEFKTSARGLVVYMYLLSTREWRSTHGQPTTTQAQMPLEFLSYCNARSATHAGGSRV